LNKKILLAFILVLAIILSAGTIHASDANVTDSYSTQTDDLSPETVSVDSTIEDTCESSVDDTSSNDVLTSEASNTLSTNTEKSNVQVSGSSAKIPTIEPSKTVTSNDVTKYYKGSTPYTASFLDNYGNALAFTDVKIVVNGVENIVKTDSAGVASLNVDLKPGTYTVVATNPVTGYSLTNSYNILSTIFAKDTTKVYKDGRRFYATFLKSDGSPLAKKVVKFKIAGKTYKAKTNSKGVASISLKKIKKGTHKIISYNKDGLTAVNKVKVLKSVKTSLTGKDYTFVKKGKHSVKVKLLSKLGYAPPKGQTVSLKISGKTYFAKTNKNGIAKFKLPKLKSGKYTAKYHFSKSGYYKASSTKGKVYIIPSKNPTLTVKSTTVFGHGAGTPFKLAVTSGKIPIVNKKVTLSVGGNSYVKTTNSKGMVSLPINLPIGQYTIKYKLKGDSNVKSKKGSCAISVVERTPTTIKWTSSTQFTQGTVSCKLSVVDANNKAVSGGTVKLFVNSKSYTAKTNKNGVATVKAYFDPGDYSVSYEFKGTNLKAPSSGETIVSVAKVTTVSIKNIAVAANNLKSYYESTHQLPNTVTAAGIQFTVPEFLYLMDQAIVQLGNSNLNDITIVEGVSLPTAPSGDNINSKNLYKADYLVMANSVASFINTNKMAPNYASTSIGKISYTELVESSARILAFYENHNNRLPNYVTITNAITGNIQSGSGLNDVNTVTDLSAYLVATTHCEVGHSSIKSIVNSVTSGLTSQADKARAIFNYVRDSISYSFYYNTKYGAVGTLKAKSGNCVDHSHLLVAMFRTAGLPARYVHGTCKFTSGSTYGHVWTQVLINGKWTVADATSSRNSLGNVANWNTKSFTLKGIYSSISF
jgi:hypothetical protein